MSAFDLFTRIDDYHCECGSPLYRLSDDSTTSMMSSLFMCVKCGALHSMVDELSSLPAIVVLPGQADC